METITMRMPEDFISMDLQDANRALCEITGDTSDGRNYRQNLY